MYKDPPHWPRDVAHRDVHMLPLCIQYAPCFKPCYCYCADISRRLYLTAEMRAKLADADGMCRKIKTAVSNVERNRAKYPHIDDLELGSRKAFVQGLENVGSVAGRGRRSSDRYANCAAA